DCEKLWISWPLTSLSMYAPSRRAASWPYSGSSAVSAAAVRMESWSSSCVVAPSYRPPMVLSATRSGSTACRPSALRVTARTILLTSTVSWPPLRLVTRIWPGLCGGVRAKGSARSCFCACIGVSLVGAAASLATAENADDSTRAPGRSRVAVSRGCMSVTPTESDQPPAPARRAEVAVARGRSRDRAAGPDASTRLPAEAVTTRHGAPAMPCRQVFGLADPGLATRLLAFASRPLRASAISRRSFPLTAAGQFRIRTGFPFEPDRRSRLAGHRQTKHIGLDRVGQPNNLCTGRG